MPPLSPVPGWTRGDVWSERIARRVTGGGPRPPPAGGSTSPRPGDPLDDLGRRLAQPPLDLAQVGVGDARPLGQVPQRQAPQSALLADVGAEVTPAVLPLALRCRHRLYGRGRDPTF